ncbi:hypothetical protein LguiB_009550 [Lonicera macranthoides]
MFEDPMVEDPEDEVEEYPNLHLFLSSPFLAVAVPSSPHRHFLEFKEASLSSKSSSVIDKVQPPQTIQKLSSLTCTMHHCDEDPNKEDSECSALCQSLPRVRHAKWIYSKASVDTIPTYLAILSKVVTIGQLKAIDSRTRKGVLIIDQSWSIIHKLKTFTRNYGPFTSFDFSRLNVQPLATISNEALQLTPDTANSPGVFDTANTSGRVLLPRHFKLFLQSNTSRIASFNSSFLINISPPRNSISKGEGLAFVIVPNPDVPVASYGEYLGLTNSSLNGNFRQDSLRLKSPT